MAKFNATGIDGLTLSMQEFAQIPDDVVEEMLAAGAKVVTKTQKEKIKQLGLVDSGKLMASIKAFSKVGKIRGEQKRYFLVYPAGKHGTRKRRLVTKQYKNSKHGRTYTFGGDVKAVTSAEVGFIHEFGAPKRKIKASQWMRKANEECAEATTNAEFEVYDRWLKSKNL